MSSAEVLSSYVKKINHPLKEIRERALRLLSAKLCLGWEFEDELSCTRELLEALLAWFRVPQPTLQCEAIKLLLATVKTKSGAYIAKEFGIRKMLSSLEQVRNKINPDAISLYEDIIETLKFINTMESETNVAVPPLMLPSIASSESDGGSSKGFYNLGPNIQTSSKESSITSEDINHYTVDNSDGIKVLLFPWVDLSPSESKTIFLIEDALRLVKSIRRSCRFIRDVFLRDFPAEIFLNRPTIVKSLLSITEGDHVGKPWEALYVLLCITKSLLRRLVQLSSVHLVHDINLTISGRKSQDTDLVQELETIGVGSSSPYMQEDGLAALKQLPAPIYALDLLNSVLSTMTRSVVLIDSIERKEILDLKELNTCLNLVEALVKLLLECVCESFWCTEHGTKIQRDIAHKSCMVMRLVGDLMIKYRRSHQEDADRCYHRAAWIRLAAVAETLLHWSRHSALPPTALVQALQTAQLDPAVDLIYPGLGKKIATVLQNIKASVDQEHKSKYKELKKLTASMESAVQFMKNKNSCRSSKTVLICIKNSLPCLQVHMNEGFLEQVSEIILHKCKAMNFDDSDWSIARTIALHLMAHNVDSIRVKFYKLLEEMVKFVLVGNESEQIENEKCLVLLCDVSILTEICCHGLSSKLREVESSASQIMQYLLRGRLVLSESSWWRVFASLLPVLPLLHVYVAHDTQLGQAICKSLEFDIAECMGISLCEVAWGLTRLMFVGCLPVQYDAAHSICRIIDDEKYLPPRELLRSDVLINAMKRVQAQGFNVDESNSPSKSTQTTGLIQILEVLKQDITLDEHGQDYIPRTTKTTILEPALRRSSLQQLSVMMRQQGLHAAFIQGDGLKLVIALLRMSLKVDDYLAFPECAVSCVSVLNSVCFATRHELLKIPDLPQLLFRVILAFPSNDSAVLLSAQVLSLVAWSGFTLQELDQNHRRIPALPQCVVDRTNLPFFVNGYWGVSPNAEHSSIDWLMSDEEWRTAIRVRWWCAYEGSNQILRNVNLHSQQHGPNMPLSMNLTSRDIFALRTACPITSCTKALLALENATSHQQVFEALNILESYINIIRLSPSKSPDIASLPWHNTRRFLCAPPASVRDTTLLIALMRFIHAFMELADERDFDIIQWIKPYFIGNDVSIISLLSRTQLYPQQSSQEDIEVTQLHIQIVKVLLRCVKVLEYCDDYDSDRMESLVKILVACLEQIDLRNFHKLGYLNDLMRCVRYSVHSRYCKLSEATLLHCMKTVSTILSGCASGGGRKGQACRLDGTVALLALLRQIDRDSVPVQRWSEVWDADTVQSIVCCTQAASAELRAAAIQVVAALAHHAQMMPQLLQAIPTDSLSEFAMAIFCQCRESNVVRTAAAELLTAITSRASPHTDILECDVLEQMTENNFIEECVNILINFCNEKSYQATIEPNVPPSLLERRSEMEVRAQKSADVCVSPSVVSFSERPPPTAALVASLCDVLHNASVFQQCPVSMWNERGLYRLLFRCASYSGSSPAEYLPVRASACRAIVAASSNKTLRTTLASTKDCIYGLLNCLKPIEKEELAHSSVDAHAQGLLLLGCLLPERSARETIWQTLLERKHGAIFMLILQCLEGDEFELQDAAIYCLSHLAQSAARRIHPDKTKDVSYIEFFDNLQLPTNRDKLGGGDSARGCLPDYFVEQYCKILVHKYQVLASELHNYQSAPDDSFSKLCSCISALLASSPRCRNYAIHRSLDKILLTTLQGIRDKLSLQGKPAEAIRNANSHPVLRTLQHVLTLITCVMVDCDLAKEHFADENTTLSLNRLWPWCMMTDALRNAVMHLLLVWTNDSPKAWAAMSMCVSGRTLIFEVCLLVNKEVSMQSKTRADTLLVMCLNTVRQCVQNQHCRAIVIKSSMLPGVHKLRVRSGPGPGSGSGSGSGPGPGPAWARLLARLARSAEGGAALLQLRGLRELAASPQLRPALMPALAMAAHHHRAALLHSPELLELLSGSLLAGDVAEVTSAAQAVWALAANNHRAKLVLRSAGLVNAVQSAMLRLQKSTDSCADKARQTLTYTNTVLNTN